MSENDLQNIVEGRDPQSGRFLAGNIGGGRKTGSRNKLAAEFVDALYQDFQVNGAAAIKRVAAEEPAQYLRIIAQVLPKEFELSIDGSELFAQAASFVEALKIARQHIGAEPPFLDLEPVADEAHD